MSGPDDPEIKRLCEWASLTGERLPEEYESTARNTDPG